MKPAPLTTGIYWVDLPCPRCHALEVALDLAGGDPRRLRFDVDGSIRVANGPR